MSIPFRIPPAASIACATPRRSMVGVALACMKCVQSRRQLLRCTRGIAGRAVQPEYCTTGPGVVVVEHPVDVVARQPARIAASEQQTERRACGGGLKQLSEQRRAPDPGEHVPAITEQHARIDERDARELRGMLRRPGEPPGSPEIVEHEVGATDPQLRQGAGEMRSEEYTSELESLRHLV